MKMWTLVGKREIPGMDQFTVAMASFPTKAEADSAAEYWTSRNGHFASYFVVEEDE